MSALPSSFSIALMLALGATGCFAFAGEEGASEQAPTTKSAPATSKGSSLTKRPLRHLSVVVDADAGADDDAGDPPDSSPPPSDPGDPTSNGAGGGGGGSDNGSGGGDGSGGDA